MSDDLSAMIYRSILVYSVNERSIPTPADTGITSYNSARARDGSIAIFAEVEGQRRFPYRDFFSNPTERDREQARNSLKIERSETLEITGRRSSLLDRKQQGVTNPSRGPRCYLEFRKFLYPSRGSRNLSTVGNASAKRQKRSLVASAFPADLFLFLFLAPLRTVFFELGQSQRLGNGSRSSATGTPEERRAAS